MSWETHSCSVDSSASWLRSWPGACPGHLLCPGALHLISSGIRAVSVEGKLCAFSAGQTWRTWLLPAPAPAPGPRESQPSPCQTELTCSGQCERL